MKKQYLSIEEIVKERPVLTEQDMANLCSYEEIVEAAREYFEKRIKEILLNDRMIKEKYSQNDSNI